MILLFCSLSASLATSQVPSPLNQVGGTVSHRWGGFAHVPTGQQGHQRTLARHLAATSQCLLLPGLGLI